MDTIVTTINSINKNQKDYCWFNLMGMNGNITSRNINILESYKEYVYWNTHIKTPQPHRPRETLEKDYTFEYFEPIMFLAKNIMDLTLEIKPEYEMSRLNIFKL
jgi:hypothetical protein